jgi:hypothetical protein
MRNEAAKASQKQLALGEAEGGMVTFRGFELFVPPEQVSLMPCMYPMPSFGVAHAVLHTHLHMHCKAWTS